MMDPSRKSSRYSSIGSEQFSVENIEELDNDALLEMIEQTSKSIRMLSLENHLLENYLSRVDPELMEEFQKQLLSVVTGRTGRMSSMLLHPTAMQVYRRASIRRSTITSNITLLEQGPRITLSIKEEIVTEEVDQLRHILEKLQKQFEKEQATLTAEIQNSVLSQQEVCDAHAALEKTLKDAKKSRNGRYMEKWLKNADLSMKILQRRTAVLHSMNMRLKHHLKLQAEGETLNSVDFEQMLIEKKQLLSCFEEKNHKLEEMKKISGKAGVALIHHKKKLKENSNGLAQLEQYLVSKKEQVNMLQKEIKDIHEVVEIEVNHLKKMQNLVSNYMCPNVMDFVKKQAEICELSYNLKTWKHRKDLQRAKLRRSRNVLKTLISKHPPSPLEDEKSEKDTSDDPV